MLGLVSDVIYLGIPIGVQTCEPLLQSYQKYTNRYTERKS